MQLIRLAVALATTVPDVTLRVLWDHGRTGTVGHHPSADMTPDDLRLLTVSAVRFGNDRVVSHIVDVDISTGLVDRGAGVYAPDPTLGHDDVATRYIVATVRDEQLDTLLRPRRNDHPSVAVIAHRDRALGTTVLEITAHSAHVRALDETADRLNAEVLVAELLTLDQPTITP